MSVRCLPPRIERLPIRVAEISFPLPPSRCLDCVEAFSAAIFWLQHTRKHAEAKRLSQFVVEEILPKMDPQNVHNTMMVLLPVIKKMKNEGKLSDTRSLFQTHVC